MKAGICGVALLVSVPALAQAPKIAKVDAQIDAPDPGIKLFVREKKAEGARASDDNTVLFVHGATFPSTPDFDLQLKDYSWADRLAAQGYVVYLFDKRNYGFSTREKAMDEPAAANRPLSRSYLVIRDIAAVVDHIRQKNKIQKVTLIGWSWGAMTAGYYASLHSEKVRKLVLYAPLYDNPLHTNLGAGSNLQDKRNPAQFNPAMGAYRLGTAEANNKRWDGEIPIQNKDEYREPAVQDAFNQAALATDPTSATRTPPALRAPNGVLEDSFYQATGRPLWNAGSILVPTLVIAGEDDTWSFPHDREGLMRDLTNAPVKRHVTIPHATHFVLFEKQRFKFFEEIESFLKGK
ncbi:MAG TPA: alpha/beta hydrolase [Myxococcales bacterium]|nr:alpha/beta hydrolase [Myxococcales bacterium]